MSSNFFLIYQISSYSTLIIFYGCHFETVQNKILVFGVLVIKGYIINMGISI